MMDTNYQSSPKCAFDFPPNVPARMRNIASDLSAKSYPDSILSKRFRFIWAPRPMSLTDLNTEVTLRSQKERSPAL